MECIAWQKKWAIGDELIDMEHKKLVQLINELVLACANNKMDSYIPSALDFLVQYTITHFDDEEALQKRCNFPEYKQHKKLHEDLKVTVGKLVAKYKKSGSTLDLKEDLYNVLAAWLVNHIEYEDKKIAPYI